VIRPLADLTRVDAATCGSKGSNLGELIHLGMPVPPGFAIAASCYAAHAERCGLAAGLAPLIERRDWTAVERTAGDLLHSRPLEPDLCVALSDAYRRLHRPGVAVRSSATAEDLTGASFAGQYRTSLNIRGEDDLQRAIRECWASLWCRRALEYRHRRSIDHLSSEMAVVIQAMLPVDASGVLFTVDPVAQRSDRILIEIVAGLGERLVSGTASGEICRVDRSDLEVVDREGGETLLPSHRAAKLCRLALEIEAHFGCPQDIEFATTGGEVFLLQTRPITTLGDALPEPLEPLGKPTFFDRLMKPLVTERYSIAPRPLDNITYTHLVGAATYFLRRVGGIVTPEDEARFRAEIWRQAYRFPPHRLTWRVLCSPWQQIETLKTDWLGWWENGPRAAFHGVCAPTDLATLSDAALLDRAERILAAWEEPLQKRMFAAGAFGAENWLKLLVTLAVGPRKSDQIMAKLLGGVANPTLETNAALWRLSGLARQAPSVRVALRELAPKRLEDTPEGRTFLRAFDDFLDAHGHREGSCWYLSTPTWQRDPMQVWRLLGSMVEVEPPSANPKQVDVHYRTACELVERRLRFIPGLRRTFCWFLHRIRALTAFREHSHFDLTRPLSALQEIAAEWGRRLVERGVLSRADDLFYLTHDEVRDLLLGPAPDTGTIHRLLAQRRATYQLANTRWQAERFDGRRHGSALKGIATSPGAARGRARIIRGEHQFERFQPGEILVCPYTTPSWTPLFVSAAAVVTETGGAASHAAIVAREYGVPAVMALQGATRILEDGVEILVDGDRGVVRRIRES
jgi:pyruvate,water dikinase